MEAQSLSNITAAAYLELDSQDEASKYEYLDGYVQAMAGGSLRHGLICGNIFAELRTALQQSGRPCRVLNSEIKLHIDSANSFLYPDTMVICGDIQTSSLTAEAVVNPSLVVEVLSPSTASYDRGDKFFLYSSLRTLDTYVLIEQTKAQLELYQRQGDLWKISRHQGLSAVITFASLGIVIPLAKIYQDVDLDE